METTQQQQLRSVNLEQAADEQSDGTIERRLTAAERVLGLVAGHVYKVDGDDQPDGRLFFVRNIELLPSWNDGNAPNSTEDLLVTFYHTPVTEVDPFNGLCTAGNVYDKTDNGTEGPLRLNAALIERGDRILAIPENATWFVQDTSNVQTLEPVAEVEDLLRFSVPSVPAP
jgi:hypothetical protein